MSSLEHLLLLAAGVLTGLHAGLLYDFSVDIVRSLRSVPAKSHILVMQAINSKIENPAFFLSFFGPVLLLPASAWLFRSGPAFPWLAAAAVLQIVLCNFVTVGGNIPLNRRLSKVDVDHITDADAERIRAEFQGPRSPWMMLHTLRTLAAIAATALTFVAALAV